MPEPEDVRPIWAQMALQEAIASVSLSHPDDCRCVVCEAASGSEEDFERFAAEWAKQLHTRAGEDNG